MHFDIRYWTRLTFSMAIAFLILAAVFVQRAKCADEPRPEGKVIEVVDEATIILSYQGNMVSCVYIGISIPEPANLLKPASSEARQMNKDLVEGKTVQLEFDERRYDRYGRLLAYVYCGDVFVNAELIRQGYGSVMIVSPNTKYAEHFLKLEREAREAKRGLWAGSDTINAPTQSQDSLEQRIAIIERKIDELSSKVEQLLNIIRKLQSRNLLPTAPDPEKADEQVDAGPTELQSDQIVYITKSGQKYHRQTCRHLKGKEPKAITIKEAERRGLQPCSVCFPEKAK